MAELEGLLLDEIGGLLQSPTLIAGVMSVAGDLAVNERYLKSDEETKILQNLRNMWDVMFSGEKHKFIRAIIERMTIMPDEVKIEYNVQGLEQVMREA